MEKIGEIWIAATGRRFVWIQMLVVPRGVCDFRLLVESDDEFHEILFKDYFKEGFPEIKFWKKYR